MAQQVTDKEAEAKVREALEKWPLYCPLKYTGGGHTVALPKIISLFFPRCRKDQWWETYIYAGSNHKTGFEDCSYSCRNCENERVRYYFYWATGSDGITEFMKVGQYPPLEDRLPKELERKLDTHDLDLYKKALRCRNFNYGLGALAYLRRVVENRMNDILDLLAEAAREADFAPDELQAIEQAKKAKRFDDKVTFGAKILPPHLRPGGSQNPIDLLHDLASEGIHAKSEDECIEIFDRSRLVFEYLFRELQLRREDALSYLETMKRLTARKSTK